MLCVITSSFSKKNNQDTSSKDDLGLLKQVSSLNSQYFALIALIIPARLCSTKVLSQRENDIIRNFIIFSKSLLLIIILIRSLIHLK
jgi:hypothetical protein